MSLNFKINSKLSAQLSSRAINNLISSATVFFDAVAGEMTGKILEAMPDGSTAFVYGGLSMQPVSNVGIMDLIFKRKTITGSVIYNLMFSF
jgi:NADPH:quinone reductase-like Zn-dependent oxidoreductase